jgi:hypothetical protein
VGAPEFQPRRSARTLDQIDERVTTLEASMRLLDNHEFRVTGVEKQAAEAATSMRAVENTLNSYPSTLVSSCHARDLTADRGGTA